MSLLFSISCLLFRVLLIYFLMFIFFTAVFFNKEINVEYPISNDRERFICFKNKRQERHLKGQNVLFKIFASNIFKIINYSTSIHISTFSKLD